VINLCGFAGGFDVTGQTRNAADFEMVVWVVGDCDGTVQQDLQCCRWSVTFENGIGKFGPRVRAIRPDFHQPQPDRDESVPSFRHFQDVGERAEAIGVASQFGVRKEDLNDSVKLPFAEKRVGLNLEPDNSAHFLRVKLPEHPGCRPLEIDLALDFETCFVIVLTHGRKLTKAENRGNVTINTHTP